MSHQKDGGRSDNGPTLEDVLSARSKLPTAVDVYCGVGGMSLGMEQAGFNVALGIELDDRTGRYAQYNLPTTKVLRGPKRGDVHCFGKSQVKEINGSKNQIALICGGSPCQGFSVAGRRRANDPLNGLVLEFARVVTELKPLAFVLENVPGITLSTGSHFTDAIGQLKKDFRITEPTELLACDYGVPQARRRIFVVGIRCDLDIHPSLPQPTHHASGVSNGPRGGRRPAPNVSQAILDLPNPEGYSDLIAGDRVTYDKPARTDYQRLMRRAVVDESDLAPIVAWDPAVCTNMKLTIHGRAVRKRFARLDHGEEDTVSGLRRLDPYGVSTTIRAGTTRDRGARSAPRPIHPYQDRVLTTRECARLQSFPDWFRLDPTCWHGNRHVGNAVPPMLARAIGAHILKLLSIEPCWTPNVPLQRDEAVLTATDS